VASMLTMFPFANTPALTVHNIESLPPTSLGLYKLSIFCPHQTPPLQRWMVLPYFCTTINLAYSRLVPLFWKEQGAWSDLLLDAIMYFLNNLQSQRQGSCGTKIWWKEIKSLNLPADIISKRKKEIAPSHLAIKEYEDTRRATAVEGFDTGMVEQI